MEKYELTAEKDLPVKETTIKYLIDSGVLSEGNGQQFKNNLELFNHLKSLEYSLDDQLRKFDINKDLSEHMEELHNYNLVKDATQSLLGSISNQTGKSVTELHKQFGV